MSYGNVGMRLRSRSLREAISSGEFLVFDKQQDCHIVGQLQEALISLDAQIERLRAVKSEAVFGIFNELTSERMKTRRESDVTFSNGQLVMPFMIHDCIVNAISLCHAIRICLDGKCQHLNDVQLFPTTPFDVEAELIESERVPDAGINEWLSNTDNLNSLRKEK